jgi:hypothetical protein
MRKGDRTTAVWRNWGFRQTLKLVLSRRGGWFYNLYIWLTKSPTDAKPRDVVRNVIPKQTENTCFIILTHL